MKNNISVKDNLVNLIAKIGEKLQLEELIFLIILKALTFVMCTLLLKRVLEK